MSCQPPPAVPETTADQVYARLRQDHDRPIIVDVREPDEWVAGHIAGAMHIPLGQLIAHYREIPTDQDVVCVCHSGKRSAGATALLRHAGYDRAVNLKGGMEDWEHRHLPVALGM